MLSVYKRAILNCEYGIFYRSGKVILASEILNMMHELIHVRTDYISLKQLKSNYAHRNLLKISCCCGCAYWSLWNWSDLTLHEKFLDSFLLLINEIQKVRYEMRATSRGVN